MESITNRTDTTRCAMDRIFLTGLVFDLIIGVLPQEQLAPQPVEIDLALDQMPSLATRTDRIDQTISYAELYDLVKHILSSDRFALVERVAGALAEALLTHFHTLFAITVTVKKPQAPLTGPFESAGITIHRRRGDYGLLSMADLSMGSNLGDRLNTLRTAVLELSGHPRIQLSGVSSVYETTPVGLVDQPDFYNLVVRIQTTLNPFELLDVCQEIEARHGRERLVRWGPRTLDIDVLTYDALTVESQDLTIPHPRMQSRAFVQIPLQELATGVAQGTPDVRLACKLHGKSLE